MATFTLPVPWRGEIERGLSGVVEVSSSDFDDEGVADARVRDLIAISNKKLRRMYAGATGLPEVNCLMFHGVKVSRNALVEFLIPELMCSSPRLVVTTQLRTQGVAITVFVKTPAGKHVTICCQLTDTVACVKTKIEEKMGIPSKEQRLVFAGMHLRDGLKLSDYTIGDATTVYLNVRLLGGFSGGLATRTFADVSDGSIITAIEFSSQAPEWRVCSKGLNIEGRCTNPECRAFRRMIIDRKRFYLFNVIRDDNVKCPICRSEVKPVTCGLYDCTWRYEGVKKDDGVSICSPWVDAKGYVYHRFNADESNGSVEWSSLVLVAKPRDDAVVVNPALTEPVQVSKDDVCSVCYSPFGSPVKGATTTTRCGHTFHRVCSQKWANYCKGHNTQASCAICRRST